MTLSQGKLPLKAQSVGTLVLYAVIIIILLISAGSYYGRVVQIASLDQLSMNDFKGIYAGSVLVSQRQNPYDYSLATQLVTCTNCPYQLPPLIATLLSPLAKMQPQQIQIIWLALNQIALIVTVIFSIRLVGYRMPLWMILLVVALILGFYPLYTDLLLGNVSLLLGALMTLTAWFWQRKQPIPAAFFLALGMVIKFVPGLMLVYFLWKREYRIILYSVLFSLVLLVLPDLLMQTSYLQTYISMFTNVLDRWAIGSLSHIDNQSLHGVFARLYVFFSGTDTIAGFVRGFSIVLTFLFGAAILLVLPRKLSPSSPYTILQYSLFLFLFPLGSSNTWSHYYAWMIMTIPVMVYLMVYGMRSAPAWKRYSVAFAAVLGFIFTSQPYRIPRLLGIDAQVPTLSLAFPGVVMQSVLVYGVVLILLAALAILFTNRGTQEEMPEMMPVARTA